MAEPSLPCLPSGSEPAVPSLKDCPALVWHLSWQQTGFNGAVREACQALQYLSRHERPMDGSQRYNAEHLIQIAHELQVTANSWIRPWTVGFLPPAETEDCEKACQALEAVAKTLHWLGGQPHWNPATQGFTLDDEALISGLSQVHQQVLLPLSKVAKSRMAQPGMSTEKAAAPPGPVSQDRVSVAKASMLDASLARVERGLARCLSLCQEGAPQGALARGLAELDLDFKALSASIQVRQAIERATRRAGPDDSPQRPKSEG